MRGLGAGRIPAECIVIDPRIKQELQDPAVVCRYGIARGTRFPFGMRVT